MITVKEKYSGDSLLKVIQSSKCHSSIKQQIMWYIDLTLFLLCPHYWHLLIIEDRYLKNGVRKEQNLNYKVKLCWVLLAKEIMESFSNWSS